MPAVTRWLRRRLRWSPTTEYFLAFVFFVSAPLVVLGYTPERMVTLLCGIVAGTWLLFAMLAE